MYKPNEKLRNIQLCSLHIMKQLHEFMITNNIQYSICGGTAIGAIVHRGFIPWDDDIDICMDRNNYNKFISLFNESDRYVLDNYLTNPNTRILISKVLDTHTQIKFETQYGEVLQSSIFVDVSVFDRIETNKFKRAIQLFLADIALITINKYPPKNNGSLFTIVGTMYLKLLPKKCILPLCRYLEKKIAKYSKSTQLPLSEMLLNRNGKIIFPPYLFEKLILVDFEDTQFYIFKEYNEYLTIKYTENYVKIPDVAIQHPHHNFKEVIIDGKKYE